MGITKYDQAAQAQFINTFSPVPFQELSQAAAMRQGRADQNLARLDAAQMAASNLRYIPNSQDQLTVEGWQRGLGDIADEYIDKDLSDPEISRKLKSSVRQLVNPNQVKAIQESRAQYDVYKKSEAQMQAKGQRVYNPYEFGGYDTLGEQGVFTGIPTMDLGAQAEQSINAFMTKPELDWREITLDSGRVGTEHYRDINKINELIDSGEFGQLLNDPAIQQLMEREGLDEQGFKQHLKSIAPSYEQSRLTSAAYPPGYGKETIPELGPIPSSAPGPAVTDAGISDKRSQIKQAVLDSEDVIEGLSFEKAELDLYGGKNRIQVNQEIYSSYKDKISSTSTSSKKRKLKEERDDKMKKVSQEYVTAKKARRETGKILDFKTDEDRELFDEYLTATGSYYGISDINNLTDKEKVEKVDEYLEYKQTHQRNPEVFEYTESGRPIQNKVFKTQKEVKQVFANRAVYDPTLPKDQSLLTVRELLDLYPLEANEKNKGFTWTPVGETTDIPRQELSMAKQMEIRDSSGEHVGTYWIAGSDQERQASMWENLLTRNIMYNTLPSGEFNVPISDTQNAVYKWNVEEREGELPVYNLKIIYPDGSGIDWISSTSMGELKTKLIDQLRFFSQEQ